MDSSEFWKHEFDYQREEVLHRLEVQNQLGQGALKSMMLTNGGAIIAVLTFVGNKGAIVSTVALQWGLGLFGFGLFAGLLAYFGGYFSQSQFMNVACYRVINAQQQMAGGEPVEVPSSYEKIGSWLLYAAVALLFLSLLSFGGGAIATLKAIV
ncbi:hypothetical protein VH570_19480 [Sphingobium sp. HT1-2]|uniref:hypothetical protein n=1 Tax=Sphingobium sp. HT1-2 TaxID=3111640 RepID=UPI003C11B40F